MATTAITCTSARVPGTGSNKMAGRRCRLALADPIGACYFAFGLLSSGSAHQSSAAPTSSSVRARL